MQSQTHLRIARHPRPVRGFTLVEILVVVAILAVLAAVVLVVTPRLLAKSRMATCASNLRQVGTLMNGYAAEHNGYYPVGGNPEGYIRRLCADLFPDGYPDTGGPKDAVFFENGGPGAIFICPSHDTGREELGKSYLGNSYVLGVKVNGEWLNNAYTGKPLAGLYDPARTYLVIEDWRRDGTKVWRGNDVRYKPTGDADNFKAHGDGRHYLYVDGHVEMIVNDPAIGDDDAFKIHYRSEDPTQ